MPKIPRSDWLDHPGVPNAVSGQNDGPYSTMPFGDVVGLTQYGVHLERLPPGSRSSHRHWHEKEDEFIYLISGQLVLIEEEENTLSAGEAAGWRAGHPVGHCLENRSNEDAVYLVIGTRLLVEKVHYPDHDIILHRNHEARHYTHADGSTVARNS